MSLDHADRAAGSRDSFGAADPAVDQQWSLFARAPFQRERLFRELAIFLHAMDSRLAQRVWMLGGIFLFLGRNRVMYGKSRLAEAVPDGRCDMASRRIESLLDDVSPSE